MIRISHLINPVRIGPASDLFIAQPITFASLLRARKESAGVAEVRLLTTQYPEDRPIIPDGFEPTPDLERSVLDLKVFEKPRKLPVLADLIGRLYEHSEGSEYLVYTNVDIAVNPEFYAEIADLIATGLDAFVITRRTIDKKYVSPEQLPEMYEDRGQPHPGHDCFVFRRDLFPKFYLGQCCIGATWFDKSLLWNLAAHASSFKVFTDRHLTFHIGDDKRWKKGDSREYSLHNKAEVASVIRYLERQLGPCYRHRQLWPVVANVYSQFGGSEPWGNRVLRTVSQGRVARRLRAIKRVVWD